MTTTTTASSSAPSSQKLGAGMAWLFAFGAVAVGIVLSYALFGMGQKVTAAIYFAVVAAGGFAATYLTRAKTGMAILAFVVSGLVAAIAYYLVVSHITAAVTSAMTDVVSLGDAKAHAAGNVAGGMFGAMFGIVAAVGAFLETIVAGIAGCVAGSKMRAQGGFSAVAAHARSARSAS